MNPPRVRHICPEYYNISRLTPYLWRTLLQQTPSLVSCRTPSLPLISRNLTLTIAVRNCSNMQTNGPSSRRQFSSYNNESLHNLWRWRPVTKGQCEYGWTVLKLCPDNLSWIVSIARYIYRCSVYQDMWCDLWYITHDIYGVLVVCCSDIIPLT